MTTMGVALQAWEGKGDWTKGQQFRDIRALFPMYDTLFHFAALKRSGIDSRGRSSPASGSASARAPARPAPTSR